MYQHIGLLFNGVLSFDNSKPDSDMPSPTRRRSRRSDKFHFLRLVLVIRLTAHPFYSIFVYSVPHYHSEYPHSNTIFRSPLFTVLAVSAFRKTYINPCISYFEYHHITRYLLCALRHLHQQHHSISVTCYTSSELTGGGCE